MSQPGANEPGGANEAKLPRRDWILLPAIGLLTICVLAVSTELLVRRLFPVSQDGLERCFVKDDPTGDAPVRPNTVCSEQIAESKYLAEYRFNSRGHRAPELAPKQPGTYRIVLIGSSLTMGLFVPREMTFAALLPKELSQETGRKVELYNEAPGGKFRGGTFPTRDSVRQFHEVLSAQPDMILWVITPWDAVNAAFQVGEQAPQKEPAAQEPAQPVESRNPVVYAWEKLTAAVAKGTIGERLKYHWEQTRTSIVLQHLLLESDSQDQYVKSYLMNEDHAGFLRADPQGNWQSQLLAFEGDVAEIEAQAKAAGVPFVAVLVPNRAQAAMIAKGEWPAGYDPYKLNNDLRDTIVSHGGTYIDILPDYKNVLNPEQRYFPVDGHPDADGHAMIAGLLAKELAGGAVPQLKAATQTQAALEHGR